MSPLEMIVLVLTAGLTAIAFWIWMLVDCIQNEPQVGHDRLIWVLVIVFTKLVGAAIYYFARHVPRLRETAAS